jgi:hypothetical protein
LESFVTMNCSRITNYGYLTSSCIHYIRWLHDVSANKELSNSDSRHVSELGFVVDTKSSTGLSVSLICSLRSPAHRKISPGHLTFFTGSLPRSCGRVLSPIIIPCLKSNTKSFLIQLRSYTVS